MTLRAGHGVALLTLALLVFGVVMVSSAGLEVGSGVPRVTSQSLLMGAPVQHALMAMVALCVGLFVPLARVERLLPDAERGGDGEGGGEGGDEPTTTAAALLAACCDGRREGGGTDQRVAYSSGSTWCSARWAW